MIININTVLSGLRLAHSRLDDDVMCQLILDRSSSSEFILNNYPLTRTHHPNSSAIVRYVGTRGHSVG